MPQLKDCLNREINIPRALRELHGERTQVSTLVLVYASALVCAGLVFWQLLRLDVPVWKAFLAGLIFLDIGGGVVANFTSSTRLYYRENKRLFIPFLLIHVVHPLVLGLLFPGGLAYFLFVMNFTITAAFAVNAVRYHETQRITAALLAAVGSALSFAFPQPLTVLYLFAPLFLIKLVLGFAVRGH